MSALVNASTVTGAAVACALMAGIYLAFSGFIMTSLGALDGRAGIEAMQSINRVILSSSFMPLFFVSTAVSLGLALYGATHGSTAGSGALIVGGLLYVVGMFVCTAAFNVPLNEALDNVDPGTASGIAVWADYLQRWTRFNHVRTIASLGATIAYLYAARLL